MFIRSYLNEIKRSILRSGLTGNKRRKHNPAAYNAPAEILENRQMMSVTNGLAENDRLEAYELDRDLRLYTEGSLFEDHWGLGEKWVRSSAENSYYYIDPNGDVFDTDKSRVASLSPEFHADPTLLTEAVNPLLASLTPDERAFELDTDLSLRRTSSYWEDWSGLGEKWFKSSIENRWYYIEPSGDLYKWTSGTQFFVGSLAPEFHADPTLLHEAPDPSLTLENAAGRAYELDQAAQLFKHKDKYFENAWFVGEKWLQSAVDDSWYYILPAGEVMHVDDGHASFVTTLSPEYFENPELLSEAVMPDLNGKDEEDTTLDQITTVTLRLDNQLNVLPEDTEVSERIKIADILINSSSGVAQLSLAGEDQAQFEIVDSKLFLRANVQLDHEYAPNLQVSILAIAGQDSGARELVQLSIADALVAESELVDDVLVVTGRDDRDDIRIEPAAATNVLNGLLAVYDGNELIGSYARDAVRAVSVLANNGDDTVDLSDIDVPSWIYGGPGNDTLVGGQGDDVIIGYTGVDTLFGKGGVDFLYGGEDQQGSEARIEGGEGTDYISIGPGHRMVNPGADIDLESLSYSDREYLDLMHKYRDAHGFVLSLANKDNTTTEGGLVVTKEGRTTDHGDAVIFTGLATTVAALRGNAEDVMSLLTTLRDKPFVHELGRARLIRHPEIWDYVRNENGQIVRERHAPLTHDGIIGVMTALHYAYTSEGMTDEVRDLARDVFEKYTDYLILNNWKTVDAYPAHYNQKHPDDDTKFANVFAGPSENRKVSFKGPEAYIIHPQERYALQNIGAEMGFITSSWDVWTDFAVTVGQVAGDEYGNLVRDVARGVGTFVSEELDNLLQTLSVHEEYRFHVIPGVDWTEITGRLDIEISAADRANVTSVVRELVTGVTRTVLAEAVDPATDIVSLYTGFNEVLSRIVDGIAELLPDWTGVDSWRPVVADALQQVLPWFNSNAFGEIIALRLSHEFSKNDFIVSHLSFWPTLLMFETRPELVDLMSWSVSDVDGYLNGLTENITNLRTGSSEFWDRDFRRMNTMIWSWLAGQNQEVDRWINRFENDARYRNLPYSWKKGYAELVDDIRKLGADGQQDPATVDPVHNRLDYLLLKELRNGDRPEGVSQVATDWGNHWKNVATNLANDLVQELSDGWNQLRGNLKRFISELSSHFSPSVPQLAEALWGNVTNNVGELAKGLGSVSNNIAEIARELWGPAGRNLGTLAGALWGNVTNNVGELAQGLGSVSNNIAEIARNVWGPAGRNLGTLAGALWNYIDWTDAGDLAKGLGSVSYNIAEIARQVWDYAAEDLAELAGALWNYIDWTDAGDLAEGLGSVSYNIAEIARQVWDYAAEDLAELAGALWNHIDWTDAGDLARGLGSVSRNIVSIARQVWQHAADSAYTLAKALWSDISWTSARDVVNGIVHAANLSWSQAWRVFYSI